LSSKLIFVPYAFTQIIEKQ